MAKVYVAYGSNLNKEQMKDRCPGAEFVGTGSIENYELQFKGSLHGAHATIAPKEGSSVPVGMWTIQNRDESRLDMYEGYNPKSYSYYNKEQIPVKMDDGSSLTGMVYIMDPRMDFGNPSKSYYDIVRQGYEDCGLDTNVLDHAVNDSMDLAQQRMECEGILPVRSTSRKKAGRMCKKPSAASIWQRMTAIPMRNTSLVRSTISEMESVLTGRRDWNI